MAEPDIVFQTLIGGIEGFADRHREIRASLAIDRNLRARDRQGDADPNAAPQRMLTGTVHGHAALLNFSEEVSQFIGPLSDVSGEASRQQLSPVHKFKGDGHMTSP